MRHTERAPATAPPNHSYLVSSGWLGGGWLDVFFLWPIESYEYANPN